MTVVVQIKRSSMQMSMVAVSQTLLVLLQEPNHGSLIQGMLVGEIIGSIYSTRFEKNMYFFMQCNTNNLKTKNSCDGDVSSLFARSRAGEPGQIPRRGVRWLLRALPPSGARALRRHGSHRPLGGHVHGLQDDRTRLQGERAFSNIMYRMYRLYTMSVCVFFPFILDIKFVGRTSRGHPGGRPHRISHPPSFCGVCLSFSHEKDSAIPFPRRP